MYKNTLHVDCFDKSLKIIFKKKTETAVALILTKSRFLKLPILESVFYGWVANTKTLVLNYAHFINNFGVLRRFLYEFLYSMCRLWFSKISFKGKGFKIKKRRRTKSIKFFFYHSHVNSIIFRNAKMRQKKKNKIIVKTWSYKNIQLTTKRVTDIRGLNVFTKRGLRASRQLVFKKAGKKSNY